MRNVRTIALSALLFSSSAFAQTDGTLPAGAETREAQLLVRVGPQTRNWIRQEAARENAAGTASEAAARRAIAANPSLQNLNDGDILALAFLVLMESSRSAREDLKSIMENVTQVNAAKAAQRKNDRQAKQASPTTTSTGATTQPALKAKPARDAIQSRPISKVQFDRQLQAAKHDADRLSKLGEEQSLQHQLAMDRKSKVESAISNLMKKMSDTGASITQHLK